MSSVGFSYAQIHVRRERCKQVVQEREKKASQDATAGGNEEGSKRAAMADETPKGGSGAGGSWASVKVHPSAGTAAQNGGR